MATLTIRNLDDPLKRRLRLRAAARNRSMEEEARQILRAALLETDAAEQPDLGARIHARFARIGGVELAIADREPVRAPPDLSQPADRRAGAARKVASPSRRRR